MAEPAIKKAITVLDMLSRDPETVRLAELRMKHILDEKSMIEGAKEEGREEGREEAAKEIARGLLGILDIQTIALKTGLSVEEIEKLKQ